MKLRALDCSCCTVSSGTNQTQYLAPSDYFSAGAHPFVSAVKSVHMVEVSPSLRKLQRRTLQCDGGTHDIQDGNTAISQINGSAVICPGQFNASQASKVQTAALT